MTRKKKLPKFPDDYLGTKANEYNSLKWMERNQKETTLRCVDYLFDMNLGGYLHKDYSSYRIQGCDDDD